MPPGKQKLQLDALFLKDANSLAYYNVRPGSVVMVQSKFPDPGKKRCREIFTGILSFASHMQNIHECFAETDK